MSFSISARNRRGYLKSKEVHYIDGCNYILGGTTWLGLDITYNYSKYFYQYVDKGEGIKYLNGRRILETMTVLNKAIKKLKDDNEADYWKATEGNAKKALINLREIGLLALKVDNRAYWEVS